MLNEGTSSISVTAEVNGNTLNTTPIDVKPVVVPMYEIYKSNNNEIWNQLEDWVVDYSDSELVMTISSKGYAKPLNTTRDGHVKLERPDEVSGDIPFTATVHNESIAT